MTEEAQVHEPQNPGGIFAVLPLLAVAVAAGIFAYQQGLLPESWSPDPYPVETLPRVEVSEMTSNATGDKYYLFVQLPHGYPDSSERYPVFYVLNGGSAVRAHDTLVLPLMRQGQIPQAIFVGIGHPRPRPFSTEQYRSRDLTIVPEEHLPYETGGAARFLSFIRNEVVPHIDATYRTDPADRGLGGHSLEGLFVLYTALNAPDLFQRYVASSPAISSGDYAILNVEEEIAETRSDLPISLYVSVGDTDYASFVLGWEQFTDQLRSRNYEGFRLKSEMLPDANHNTAVVPAAHHGLTYVYDRK